MSRKTSNVFRTAFQTMDKSIDTNSHNNSQLYFRPLQAPLNTVDDSYYSLGAAQTTDPTIRLNKYDASGALIGTGYMYDSVFNIPPPGKILIVAGGNAPHTLVYSQDRAYWSLSPNGASLLTTACYALAYDGFTWLAGGLDLSGGINIVSSSNGINWLPELAGSAILTGSCNAIATNGTLWVAGGRGVNSQYPGITNSMCFSYDTLTWYKAYYAETIFTGATVSAIAQNGSIWLAGSSGGTPPYSMAYADDGITWIALPEASALLRNCYIYSWNGTLWNAGGDTSGTGTILYSLNGRFWSSSPSGSVIHSSVKTISWNGTIWTAGGTDLSGQGRTLGYSYDGINWLPSPSTSIFLNACNSITWDGIKWQAVGDSGIATSFNGIDWTQNSQGSTVLPEGNAVAFYKALPFVTPGPPNPVPTTPLSLVGGLDKLGNCAIAYSTNGVSWTTSTQVPTVFTSSLPTTLVWNGSLWIGGFFTDGMGSPTVGYSYDGIIWATAITGNSGMDLVFYNAAWRPYTNGISGEFIGVGSDLSFNTILNKSFNGTSWSSLSPSLSPPNMRMGQNNENYVYPQIAYNGAVWILTGAGSDISSNNASIAYSSDGNSWYKSTSGSTLFTEHCSAVVWNGAIWVAGGRNNVRAVVAYSSDGINWLEGTLNGIWTVGVACDIYTIAWNGTLFTIGGTGDDNRSNTGINIGYSYDGVLWYPAQYTFTEANTINSITWNGSLWVATGISNPLLEGYLGTLFYSYSGVEWYISPDVNLIFQIGNILGSNEVNPANGNTLPPPVYNQGSTASGGSVLYTTGNNDIYKSKVLSVDETDRVLTINQTYRNYQDLSGDIIKAAVEISGGAITVNTGSSVPGLYLRSNNSTKSGGRIELSDLMTGYGWQIDNSVSVKNHLQITNFVSGGPQSLAMDISNNSSIGIGTNADGSYALKIGKNLYIKGNLTVSGTKSFLIDHPNPALTDTHYLRHCCVEGPTRGDNLYRWTLTTENKSCVQTLPSYSPYLNEDWHFFVTAEDSFGTGYATLSPCESFFTLTVNEEGTYSVVGIATRKDREALKFDEKGVEYRRAC